MNPKHKLRPKADAPEIRRLFEAGWRARCLAIDHPQETATAREAIRARLLERFPPEDMATLARYGFAKLRSELRVSVCASGSDRYEHRFAFPLGGDMFLPDSADMHAGGVRWADADDERQLHVGVWEQYSEEKRQQLRDYWADSDRRRVPDVAESWFVNRADANEAYRAEARALWEFVTSARTWGDLIAAFPAIGEAVHSERCAALEAA